MPEKRRKYSRTTNVSYMYSPAPLTEDNLSHVRPGAQNVCAPSVHKRQKSSRRTDEALRCSFPTSAPFSSWTKWTGQPSLRGTEPFACCERCRYRLTKAPSYADTAEGNEGTLPSDTTEIGCDREKLEADILAIAAEEDVQTALQKLLLSTPAEGDSQFCKKQLVGGRS